MSGRSSAASVTGGVHETQDPGHRRARASSASGPRSSRVGGLPASAAATTQYLTGAATTGDVTTTSRRPAPSRRARPYGVAFGAPAASRRRDRDARRVDDLDGHGRQGQGRRHGQGGRRSSRPPTRGPQAPARPTRTPRSTPPRSAARRQDEPDDADDAARRPRSARPRSGVNNAETQVVRRPRRGHDLGPRSGSRRSRPRSTASSPTVNVSQGPRRPVRRRDRHRRDDVPGHGRRRRERPRLDGRRPDRRPSRSRAVGAQRHRQGHRDRPDRGRAAPTGSVVSYPVTVSLTGRAGRRSAPG